jgi:hypothetical protein
MKTHVLLAPCRLATGFVVPAFTEDKHTAAVVAALATPFTSQFAALKYDYTLANASSHQSLLQAVRSALGEQQGETL